MGKSADAYQTTVREENALLEALRASASLPPDWLALPPGRALRRLRKKLGVGQDELGFQVGLRQSSVSKIERGQDARWSTLRALFEALGCRLVVVPVSGRSVEALRALFRLRRLERQARARREWQRLMADLKDAEQPPAP